MNRAILASVAAVALVLVLWATIYTFQQCGAGKTLLYGKGAFWAAIMGYCDDQTF